ncbi:hypothetical protein ACSMXN_19345 [Jatrophihabitans sp. DSM 45814]
MDSGAQPSWHEVLADCEAAADEAERILASRTQFDPDQFVAKTTFDLWQLNLPPLPLELHARAEAVHARQLRVQADLAAAMISVQQQILMSAAEMPDRHKPMYLDCSA